MNNKFEKKGKPRGRSGGSHPIGKEYRERAYPMLSPKSKQEIIRIGKGELSAGIDILLEFWKVSRAVKYKKISEYPLPEKRAILMRQCGWRNESAENHDDTYDGECPECGGFAIFWSPLKEYIKNPSAHFSCENGHQK